MSDEIERTLLVKPEVFMYQIPPMPNARGYRASDWNLTKPDWTGRMRVLVKGKRCVLRLEDKTSGELFAECPVERYPGGSVEAVIDSSRYFVICVKDEESGRRAFIGIGFADRSDSFDLNVTLQDHFNLLKKEDEIAKEPEKAKPALDLAFKEGQTIRINIPKKDGSSSSGQQKSNKTSTNLGTGFGNLPPPPGGAKIGPPPGQSNLTPVQSPSEPQAKTVIGGGGENKKNSDLLGDFFGSSQPTQQQPQGQQQDSSSSDVWGDFASAAPVSTHSSGHWVQF